MKPENVPTEIIGVVADNKHLGLDRAVEPMVYWPHAELAFGGMTIMLRTSKDASAVAPAACVCDRFGRTVFDHAAGVLRAGAARDEGRSDEGTQVRMRWTN